MHALNPSTGEVETKGSLEFDDQPRWRVYEKRQPRSGLHIHMHTHMSAHCHRHVCPHMHTNVHTCSFIKTKQSCFFFPCLRLIFVVRMKHHKMKGENDIIIISKDKKDNYQKRKPILTKIKLGEERVYLTYMFISL